MSSELFEERLRAMHRSHRGCG